MTTSGRPTVPALIAVAAFGALSLLGGWIVVCGGGFNHAPAKYSSQTLFVSGMPAVLMALLQLLAAALAFTWILRRRFSSLLALCLAFGGVFAPPLVYILIR
jgi:hypothetical protein